MGIISKFTKFDKCVYWAPDASGETDRMGRRSYEDPVELDCRWDGRSELITLPNGEQYASKATVYTDIELALGGILWHGLLVARPDEPPSANVIQSTMTVPKMRNTEVLKAAYL